MQSHSNKQEFFTLDTRITIQRGNIYHRNVKSDTENGAYRNIVFVLYIVLVYLTVWQIVDEGEYYRILRVVFSTIFLVPLFKRIFQTLFIKTWKSIIPIKDVKNITTKPLENGLETEVTLHLQNGHKKFYTFRNAEGQLEPFKEAVAVHETSNAHVAL